MGKEKPKVQHILEGLFSKAVDRLAFAEGGKSAECLFVQLDINAGEVQIYDGEEHLLEKNIIFDWAGNPFENDADVYQRPIQTISAVLATLKSKKIFDSPALARPFSIFFTDDNFNKIETLLFLEDDGYRSDGPIMKNLEQDLRNFSKKLFADV